MKYCPQCGSQLPIGTAKFCSNCGEKLWITNIEDTTPSQSVSKSKDDYHDHMAYSHKEDDNRNYFVEHSPAQEEQKISNVASSIHSLGIKLEELVEKILNAIGYSYSERRKKLIGKSNIAHEIDVYATRGYEVLAVECKNYGEGRKVGTEELRNFQGKIEDLSIINHKLFVTNIDFTPDARTYASYHKIDLWNGERLMQLHYQMNIGRLGPPQLSSTKIESILDKKNLEELVLGSVLPLSMNYKQVTTPLLVNPLSIEIHNSILDWHPYYVFDYYIDMKTGILGRKRYTESRKLIVDAATGEKLEEYDVKADDTSFCFIPKKYSESEEFEEVADDIERNQIIKDLISIEPKSNYKLDSSSLLGPCNINKIEAEVPINAAQRMMLDEIVEDTKAKYDDIQLKNSSLIYVPKWIVNFQTITSGKTYRREALAASNTVIIDEISLCPKEALARIRPSKKPIYAICDRCGNAYCRNHIEKKHDFYYCKDCR